MRLSKATVPRRRTISLTPLIDVVFILLLFFMLSSNFMRWNVIDLVVPESGASATGVTQRLVLEDNQGNFRVGAQRLHWSDVSGLRLLSAEAEAFYVIETADEVNTQALVTLLDKLKSAGITRVSLGGLPGTAAGTSAVNSALNSALNSAEGAPGGAVPVPDALFPDALPLKPLPYGLTGAAK